MVQLAHLNYNFRRALAPLTHLFIDVITSPPTRALLRRDMNGVVGRCQTATSIRRVQKVTRRGAGIVVDCLAPDVVVARRQAVDESTSTTGGRRTTERKWIYPIVSPDTHRLVFHSSTYIEKGDFIDPSPP